MKQIAPTIAIVIFIASLLYTNRVLRICVLRQTPLPTEGDEPSLTFTGSASHEGHIRFQEKRR